MESWANSKVSDAELTLPGYTLFRCDRKAARAGGGVLLYINSTLDATEYEPQTPFPEQVWCQLTNGKGQKTHIGVCYRTPSEDIYGSGNHDLIRQLLSEMGRNKHFILMGDFNYGDVDWTEPTLPCKSQHSEEFMQCLEENFLSQQCRYTN
jgi:hypothetical protein